MRNIKNIRVRWEQETLGFVDSPFIPEGSLKPNATEGSEDSAGSGAVSGTPLSFESIINIIVIIDIVIIVIIIINIIIIIIMIIISIIIVIVIVVINIIINSILLLLLLLLLLL